MLEVNVKNGKITIKKCSLTFSGDPIEVRCDNSYLVRLYSCPACKSEAFDFTLDVYRDTDLSVPFIIINSIYRVPLYRPFLFRGVYIEVIKDITDCD